MSLLEEVKLDLRIKHTAIDSSIDEDIQTALELISTAGVRPDTTDSLVKRAVKFYLRYVNDYDSRGADYKVAFDDLLKTMTLSSKRRLNEE